MNLSDFGQRLDSLRIEGERKSDFATRIGIHQTSLSRYYAGNMPDRNVLLQISERTGADLNWLLTGQGEARPQLRQDQGRPSRLNPELTFEDKVDELVSMITDMESIDQKIRIQLGIMIKRLFLDPEYRKRMLHYGDYLGYALKNPPKKGKL